MRHEDHLSKFPLLDHGVQIPLLILSGIWIVRRLIGSSPPEKIKGQYAPRGERWGEGDHRDEDYLGGHASG